MPYGLVNNEWVTPPTIYDTVSKLLESLGFTQMAQDVYNEPRERLSRYAAIILKNSPQDKRNMLVRSFRLLRLL